MKYIRLRVWLLFLALIGGFILLIQTSIDHTGPYKSSSPIKDDGITSSYPKLYQALTFRSATRLIPFLTDSIPQVRQQAWRALANTPVDSAGRFIDLAAKQNSAEAWLAISQADLMEKHLRRLQRLWEQNPKIRNGVATVLGQQGDDGSLEFLLKQLSLSGVNPSQPVALAVGRLLSRYETSADQQIKVVQHAFETPRDEITRAYLYGWYRNPEIELDQAAQDTLYKRWQLFGAGNSPEVDQYVNRLLKEHTTYTLVIYYNGEQELEDEVQLSIELAQSLSELSLTSRNALAAKILLTHPNPHVQRQTLQSLEGKITKGDNLYRYVTQTLLVDQQTPNPVWLAAFKMAYQAGLLVEKSHRERLEEIYKSNIYLLPEVLEMYAWLESHRQYLKTLDSFISSEDSLATGFAVEGLYSFWESLNSDQKTEDLTQKVRELVFEALQQRDRGVTYRTKSLLQQEELFQPSDFPKINELFTSFSLPEDIEVFQSLGTVYKQFEEQGRSVIDSLAALGYPSLNRSFKDAGWQVRVPDTSMVNLRLPQWQRLWQLGRHPILKLETEKGEIQVRMNTLSAPATVAAIDSLSRAGAYKDVPFHRVVPNFVIQGGDIERGDGFGSPAFTLPTEASEKGFRRGTVGIASAGRDTEGTQFFIMHQWKPHLNGNYTYVGEVVEGMQVVDRIIPGDRIRSVHW